jgi:uncharacterized protein (DUF58 family)
MWDPRDGLDDPPESSTDPTHVAGLGVIVTLLSGVVFITLVGEFAGIAGIVVGGIGVVVVSLSGLAVVIPERVAGYLEGKRGVIATAPAIAALVLGGLAVAAPGSLLAPIADVLSGLGTTAAVGLVLLCLVVAGLGLWKPRPVGGERFANTGSIDDPDTQEGYADEDDGGSTGERIDDLLEHIESGGIPWQNGDTVVTEAENVWTELRGLAVEAVAERDDCSRTVASSRVASGEWTEDPYARSFLQDLSTPVLPVRVRVADWLRGRHLTRRVRHTVDAIAAARNATTASGVGFGDGPSDGISETDPDESGGVGETESTEEDVPGSRSVQRGARLTLRPVGGTPGHGPYAGVVIGIVAVIVGTVLGNAAVLLSAVVGCAYAAYGYAMPDPGTDVTVERWVETASPATGTSVAVSVTVTNEGETAIPDLRVRDTPPENLSVIGGETAMATSLGAGETAELAYRVETTTGTHRFGETELLAENVSGTAQFRGDVTIDTRISCDHTTNVVPLSSQTTPFEGRVPADAGGAGTEFYATREYRAGDPPNRIDWNRYASTREPTTIQFREHRAAEVLVVLDANSPADVRRSTTADPVTLGRAAAGEIVTRLLAANNAVGAARVDRFDTTAFGRRATIDYMRPLADDLQSTRIERLFTTEVDDIGSALNSGPFPEDSGGMDRCVRFKHDGVGRLVGSIADETQVIALTPLLDDRQVDALTRLLSAGHDVTVAMPDVLPDTPGGRIDGLDRADRIDSLRRQGAVVLPWKPGEPLSIALARSPRREVVTA